MDMILFSDFDGSVHLNSSDAEGDSRFVNSRGNDTENASNDLKLASQYSMFDRKEKAFELSIVTLKVPNIFVTMKTFYKFNS